MPDGYVNLVDFGGAPLDQVPDAATNAALNAGAFRAALGSGARQIFIPAGRWYFEEIRFEGNDWLPRGCEIVGQGVEESVLLYRPADTGPSVAPAFQFSPGDSWGLLANFFLIGSVPNQTHFRDPDPSNPGAPAGPVIPNTPPVGAGISLDASRFNRVRDVVIQDFEAGIEFNRGAPGTYSAHNVVERFGIARCATGIRVRDASNANVIMNGRIWHSLIGYDATHPLGPSEAGTAIDIEGNVTPTGNPVGAQVLMLSGLSIEAYSVGLRAVSTHEVVVQGCYFESGAPPAELSIGANQPQLVAHPYGRRLRRAFEVDEHTTRLTAVGNYVEEGPVPPGQHNWTPTNFASPPELRGLIDNNSFPRTGTAYGINGYGAGVSGATAAHANRIKNADMSRGTMFWLSSTPAPDVLPDGQTFVTGGASLVLHVQQHPTEHIYQDVIVDSGVRTVTVNVRYRLRGTGVRAFRFDLFDVASGTVIGFFSDVDPAPEDWRIRSLTGRFDGLPSGVVGPRTLRVRIFPYHGDVALLGSQTVQLDSVWIVDGEYAAPYRPYGETVELLTGADREIFFSGGTTSDLGPRRALPARVPSNAVGMIVEISVTASAATQFGGAVSVNEHLPDEPPMTISATLDGRPTTTELTVPLHPFPTWTVSTNSPINKVAYRVRLKSWILRPC